MVTNLFSLLRSTQCGGGRKHWVIVGHPGLVLCTFTNWWLHFYTIKSVEIKVVLEPVMSANDWSSIVVHWQKTIFRSTYRSRQAEIDQDCCIALCWSGEHKVPQRQVAMEHIVLMQVNECRSHGECNFSGANVVSQELYKRWQIRTVWSLKLMRSTVTYVPCHVSQSNSVRTVHWTCTFWRQRVDEGKRNVLVLATT